MGRWHRFTEEERRRMLRLHEKDGLTYNVIARRFGIDPVTVRTLCKKEESTCESRPSQS